jgi:hypothetical protein
LGSLAAGEWPYWAGSHALVRLRLVSTRYLTPDAADEIDLLTASVRAAGGPLRLVPGGRS